MKPNIKSILLATALSASGSSSFAYHFNANSFVMVREGLANSAKPMMSDCSLPEDLGNIINKPKTYKTRLNKCLSDLDNANSVIKVLPMSCKQIEGLEFLQDNDDIALDEALLEIESIKENNVNAINTAIAAGASANDAVLVSSVMCAGDNGDETYIRFVGLIKGKGKSAVMSVVEIVDALNK